jgi:hypothetical protein
VTTIFSINNPNTAVLGIPAVNSAGTVAFAAQRDAVLTGIYTGNGGPLTTVVDNTGAFGLFLGGLGASLGAVGIDGRGNVVFGAAPKSGGTQGLFSGPDPLADKVIALNDILDGARVSYLGFGPNGMNDSGQVAFVAVLSDGRQEIFRADPAPVPEPGGQKQGRSWPETGTQLGVRLKFPGYPATNFPNRPSPFDSMQVCPRQSDLDKPQTGLPRLSPEVWVGFLADELTLDNEQGSLRLALESLLPGTRRALRLPRSRGSVPPDQIAVGFVGLGNPPAGDDDP